MTGVVVARHAALIELRKFGFGLQRFDDGGGFIGHLPKSLQHFDIMRRWSYRVVFFDHRMARSRAHRSRSQKRSRTSRRLGYRPEFGLSITGTACPGPIDHNPDQAANHEHHTQLFPVALDHHYQAEQDEERASPRRLKQKTPLRQKSRFAGSCGSLSVGAQGRHPFPKIDDDYTRRAAYRQAH